MGRANRYRRGRRIGFQLGSFCSIVKRDRRISADAAVFVWRLKGFRFICLACPSVFASWVLGVGCWVLGVYSSGLRFPGVNLRAPTFCSAKRISRTPFEMTFQLQYCLGAPERLSRKVVAVDSFSDVGGETPY